MSLTSRLNVLVVVIVLGSAQVGLAVSSKENPKNGKKIFLEGCQICHGPTGKGDPDMAAHLMTPLPDLSAKKTQAKTDAELRKTIMEGHPGTSMWSYKGAFNEEELADLIAYLRSLKP